MDLIYISDSIGLMDQLTSRYMNWYHNNNNNNKPTKSTRSKSEATKSGAIKVKDQRSQSVQQTPESNAVNDNDLYNAINADVNDNLPPMDSDGDESGISSMSHAGGKNSTLMQKKSVFTIAYEDMATQEIHPNSAGTD